MSLFLWFGALCSIYYLAQNVAVWFFQISVVVVESLFHNKSTLLIELFAYLIDNMHVEVNSNCISVFFDFLFKALHHLISDFVFAVWFQNSKSENVGMFLLFVILYSHSICSNYNVIEKAELG